MTLTETINEHYAKEPAWSGRLRFYTDEIRLMSFRMKELDEKNHSTAFTQEQNDLQTALTGLLCEISEIRKEIRKNELTLVLKMLCDTAPAGQHKMICLEKERELMNRLDSNFREIRLEFGWFYRNWK